MKKLATLFLIYFVVLLSACPSANSIQSAKKQSARIAGYANGGIEVTRILFNERAILFEQKNKIADAFIELAHAGQAFDATILRLESVYGQSVPPNEIEALFTVFDSQLVGKFVAILTELKVISAGNRYAEIIALIQTAVLVIAKAFGKSNQIQLKLQAV